MYLFDPHVHTEESSPCGNISAEDTVRLYRAAGFGGVCITDHYNMQYFDRWGCASWEQTMERFLAGYRKAAEYGARLDMTVLLGAELMFCGSPNEYLLYGLTEQFLFGYPELYNYGLERFRELAKEHGILIFQAHPFRPRLTRAEPRLLDGVEVINGNRRHNSQNDLAAEFAETNNLCISGGSDCHELEDVGKGGMLTGGRIQNMDTLKQYLTVGPGKRKIVPNRVQVTL